MASNPTVLLSRPRADSESIASELKECGAQIVIASVLEIKKLRDPDVSRDQTIVFTSRHAVTPSPYGALPALCVGAGTAARARANGYDVTFVAETVGELREHLAHSSANHLHYLRGEHVKRDLIIDDRHRLTETIVYAQHDVAWSDQQTANILGARVLIAPVFSPRSADALGQRLIGFENDLHLIAISGDAADAWSGPAPNTTAIAAAPTRAAMLLAIRRALGD